MIGAAALVEGGGVVPQFVLPISEEECHRLSELHALEILDTLPEADYDWVTQIAATICDTPIALITLVDRDRQWFKSRLGLAVAETSREISFCTRAIEGSALFEVRDARTDPRFADNPLVLGDPRIRFYAGAPLVTRSGFAIGTLCVIDRVARVLTPAQREALVMLAGRVVEFVELRRDRSRHRATFEANPLPSWIVESETLAIIDSNEAAARLTGEAGRGSSFGLLLGVTSSAIAESAIRRGECLTSEPYRLRTCAGVEIATELTVQPIAYDGRQACLVIALDVTSRLADQAELARTDRELRELVESSRDVMYQIDPSGTFTFINSAVERLLGYAPEELIGTSFVELVHPEHRQMVVDFYKTQLREQLPFTYLECPCLSRDGQEVWVAQHVQTLVENGRVRSFHAVARDITDLRAVQRERRTIEDRFQAFMDNSPALWFVKDSQGRYLGANPTFEQMFGIYRHSVIGMTDEDFMDDGAAAQFRATDEAVLGSGLASRAIETLTTPAGVTRHWLTSRFPLPSQDAETCIGGIAVDVTDRVTLESELALARDNALASAREKSEFLANMSHEIRTPMNGVLGMLGVLLDSSLDADQRDLAATAKSSAEALLTVINDILDFSKLEAGKMAFETSAFDVQSTIDGVLDLLAEGAKRKSLDIGCVIAADVPAIVEGDAGRVRQVLLNLVGNAIKFTTSGGVVVRVSCASRSEESATLLFRVTDSGIGITRKASDTLFQPFVQADASTTRRFGGTGLGLAISRQLVLLMNGDIGVESEEGQGSTFWFTARFGATQQAAAALTTFPRVLIVDDSETARMLMSLQLATWGAPNSVAAGAAEALVALRTARAEGDPFRVIVSDLEMAGMDGVSLARMVAAQPQFASPKFIVVSASVAPSDADTLARQGIAVWLTKPMKQRLLQAAIFGEGDHRRAELPPEATVAQPRSARVLVVEDNAVNQKVALRQLQKLGHTGEAVANGLEALDALQNLSYDIVLMDCHMPEMDGFAATRAIRMRENGNAHIPILALTASAFVEDRQRCLDSGMDDVVTKPVREADLASALARWLAPDAVSLAPVVSAPAVVTDSPFDVKTLSELHALADGDDDFLDSLYAMYLEQCDEQMAGIVAAADGSPEPFSHAAHSLAGSSRNIAAKQLGDLCTTAERHAEEMTVAERNAAAAAIAIAMEQVKAAISQRSYRA